MSEKEVINEIYSREGNPSVPEVADRVERHVRLPNGDIKRSYIELEPQREPEDGDVLTIESASRSTPESRATSFDIDARETVSRLSTCRDSRESGRAAAAWFAGDEDRPIEWSFSQLEPRFQTEERRRLVEEVRWLAEQQVFETDEERRSKQSEMEAEARRLRGEGNHAEADALLEEWRRKDKVIWPGRDSNRPEVSD